MESSRDLKRAAQEDNPAARASHLAGVLTMLLKVNWYITMQSGKSSMLTEL